MTTPQITNERHCGDPERRPACVEYERRKAAWHALNPNASPDEVEAARVRIARQLGI